MRSGAMRENLIPVLKINGNVRFRRSDIEEWIAMLVAGGKLMLVEIGSSFCS